MTMSGVIPAASSTWSLSWSRRASSLLTGTGGAGAVPTGCACLRPVPECLLAAPSQDSYGCTVNLGEKTPHSAEPAAAEAAPVSRPVDPKTPDLSLRGPARSRHAAHRGDLLRLHPPPRRAGPHRLRHAVA